MSVSDLPPTPFRPSGAGDDEETPLMSPVSTFRSRPSSPDGVRSRLPRQMWEAPPANHSRTVRTFADVLTNGAAQKNPKDSFNAFRQPLPSSFDNIYAGKPIPSEPVGIKEATMMNGKPCIYLSNDELDLLSKPLDLTLIGKFPAGRPKWITLQRYYRDLKLLGDYKLQHLDSKHIIIHFSQPDDYIRVFTRTIVNISGCTIKYLKWSKEFDVNIEPSVTPIWISMPMLCMNLFTQNMIFSIAKVFGRPLLLDTPTAMGTKPGVARALVEMDLLKDHPAEVLMGNEEFSHVQEVIIERKPRYCAFCSKYGHVEQDCFVKDPDKKKRKKRGILSKEGKMTKNIPNMMLGLEITKNGW